MTKCKMVIPMLVVVLALGISGCAKQVKSVSLNKTTLTAEHGIKFTLTAAVMPNDADDQSVAWSVDTQNVSAVTNENMLQKEFLAANVGVSNVRVVSSNGLGAICKVTVTENAEDKEAREKAEEEARIAAEKKAAEDAEKARLQAKKDAKSLSKGDINISLVNDLPATFTYYFMGVRSSSCKITKIYLEKDRIGWYDLFIEGTKTFDDDGNNGKTPCRIDWTIYNENGIAVDSFDVGSPQVKVGESFIAERKAAIKSLPPGNYALKLSDHNVN